MTMISCLIYNHAYKNIEDNETRTDFGTLPNMNFLKFSKQEKHVVCELPNKSHVFD
jgi:hypothetical protein